MSYGERNSWTAFVGAIVGVIVYLTAIVPQLGTTPVRQIEWMWPMIWSIGGAIVFSIVFSIVWGIIAGIRHPEDRQVEDVRDKDISRLGSRVGQAFLVVAMLGVLVLSAMRADWFWIANTVYLGFAASAILDGLTRVITYRAGMI